MVPPLDIFRVEKDGNFVWQDTAETLELAKARVTALMASLPGDYVIFSQKTGHKTFLRMEKPT